MIGIKYPSKFVHCGLWYYDFINQIIYFFGESIQNDTDLSAGIDGFTFKSNYDDELAEIEIKHPFKLFEGRVNAQQFKPTTY